MAKWNKRLTQKVSGTSRTFSEMYVLSFVRLSLAETIRMVEENRKKTFVPQKPSTFKNILLKKMLLE